MKNGGDDMQITPPPLSLNHITRNDSVKVLSWIQSSNLIETGRRNGLCRKGCSTYWVVGSVSSTAEFTATNLKKSLLLSAKHILFELLLFSWFYYGKLNKKISGKSSFANLLTGWWGQFPRRWHRYCGNVDGHADQRRGRGLESVVILLKLFQHLKMKNTRQTGIPDASAALMGKDGWAHGWNGTMECM